MENPLEEIAAGIKRGAEGRASQNKDDPEGFQKLTKNIFNLKHPSSCLKGILIFDMQ